MCLNNAIISNSPKISNFSKIQYLRSNSSEISNTVLKDIFKKGLTQSNYHSENDELLDVTSLLLVKVHKDKTILPSLADTIFLRNRKGLFTFDLIWAFFEARDPYSLMFIANYLESDDITDVKLARKLLDFVPSIDMIKDDNSKKQYMDFFRFLKENSPFLHFTGESFQRTSRPVPYVISTTAKYLCRQVSHSTGKPLIPFTNQENNLLDNFNKLDDDMKSLLSSFSLRVHYENLNLWNSWINNSISNQICFSQTGLMF